MAARTRIGEIVRRVRDHFLISGSRRSENGASCLAHVTRKLLEVRPMRWHRFAVLTQAARRQDQIHTVSESDRRILDSIPSRVCIRIGLGGASGVAGLFLRRSRIILLHVEDDVFRERIPN